ncbi:hypothetical protein [Floricoccus penangensis]|uniref:Uncharacterized protein n=1 Tax=Floricoccus penangensis TaxID=1859475 RepID=A0A9Q5JF15_9LACT|nr:hypothetical protein [Floricoccus penangensis]OFI46018.1 hypothetical protein BG262_05910 [Floricoccus penangensis]URZ86509.1 hypothetical protein KIW23_05235 [Floricoccus penangensis]
MDFVEKIKEISRETWIALVALVIIFASVAPIIHRNVRAEQTELVKYVATNDKIKDISDKDVGKYLSDNLATTIIFIDPRNSDLNKDLFKYILESNGNTKLNREIFIYEEIYPTKFLNNLKLDMNDKIPVVFFEGNKKTKVVNLDKKTNLKKDFANIINKISMGE